MKECGIVSKLLNEFNKLIIQLISLSINWDNKIKAIVLLWSTQELERSHYGYQLLNVSQEGKSSKI